MLEELSKIFLGQTSSIFASRNEQLIRELLVKEDVGWQEWIPILCPEQEYEQVICKQVTIAKINAVITEVKDRDGQVDGYHSEAVVIQF